MAYEFGQDYTGLFASDYEAIADSNQSLKTWLTNNMEKVDGEDFYIYVGDGTNDGEFELIDTLFDNGLDDSIVTTFTYLRSTWLVNGF